MRKHLLWCLYNIQTGKIVEGLLFDEVRANLFHLSDAEKADWFVWHEGWEKWENSQKFKEFFEKPQRVLAEQIPNLPTRIYESNNTERGFQSLKSLPEDVQSNEIPGKGHVVSLESISAGTETIRPRKYKRYKKEILVEVECNGLKFNTRSEDVGVGGILLKDSLPEWVVGYFKVRLRKPNERTVVELTSYIVENQSPGKRRRIGLLPLQKAEDAQRLEMWLKAA